MIEFEQYKFQIEELKNLSKEAFERFKSMNEKTVN